MSQPNTAAIAVASIFGGIAFIFFSYKAYRKIWNCMHRPEELPPISQPQTAYHGGVVMSTVSDIPTTSSFKRSPSSTDALAVLSPSGSSWQQRDALTSTSTSEMPSPSIQALDSVVVSSPSEIYDPHYRGASTISSSSSTMTLKRSYLRSPSSSQLSYMSSSSRRESYLPHSPFNRDSIQIVPPQPLGFGGSMAMATDQKTLAFSNSSGIGTAAEDFTSELVWTNPNAYSVRSAPSRRPQLRQQDKQKYLMEGPVSSRNSEAPSQQASAQTSPVCQPSSLYSPAQQHNELPFSKAQASDSQHSSSNGLPKSEPSTTIINPHLLGAKDSPLQRLQSNAGQAHTSPHSRLPSDGNSNRSDSDASPILSPFVHHSSPPSTGDGTTNHSVISSSDAHVK